MASGNGKNAWKNRIIGYGEEAPDQLLANPMNFRVHPKDQQAATEGSLDTLGWIDDVIVNKTTGHVVDGHLRVTLAMRNSEPTVPVKYVELTEAEEYQALLSLDPIAAMAATDKAKLDEVLHGVNSDDKRVQEFIAELAKREGLQYGAPPPDDPGAQMDRAEALREKWGVESGQLWRLGDHRLICGDCTDRAVVERVMGGEKAGAVVTDPPYGINLDTDYSNPDGRGAFRGRKYSPVVGDDKPFDAGFLRDVFKDVSEQFWFGANYYYRTLGVPDGDGSWLVWDKRIEEAKDAVIGSAFELCWSATKHAQRIIRYQWTNWTSHDNAGMRREHPTEKPIPVIEEIINRWINNHGFVVDPFMGAGTTLIACERLGRKCRAVEISPAYCAVAIQRWVDMTGGEPELVE